MNEIDRIILRYSTRGMDKVYMLFGQPLCVPAAEAFAALRERKKGGRIFLYTGFYANGHGETDGPLGAKFLYQAMERLGFVPLIMTDSSCAEYFQGMEERTIFCGEDSDSEFRRLLQKERPIAHFSVERLSADSNGQYCNYAGEDISKYCPRLDRLFAMAKTAEFSAPTFAVGDGGNEIGMGNFNDILKNTLGISAACTTCDYPILASISNWGAYGFLAALQQKIGMELLPDFGEVEKFLCHIVQCGATDGINGRNEMTVDGKDFHVDAEILDALRAVFDYSSD